MVCRLQNFCKRSLYSCCTSGLKLPQEYRISSVKTKLRALIYCVYWYQIIIRIGTLGSNLHFSLYKLAVGTKIISNLWCNSCTTNVYRNSATGKPPSLLRWNLRQTDTEISVWIRPWGGTKPEHFQSHAFQAPWKNIIRTRCVSHSTCQRLIRLTHIERKAFGSIWVYNFLAWKPLHMVNLTLKMNLWGQIYHAKRFSGQKME